MEVRHRRRHQSTSKRPGLVAAINARLVFVDEASGLLLNAELVKTFSGMGEIKARNLGTNPILSFVPRGLLVFGANDAVKFSERDAALERRHMKVSSTCHQTN